MKTLKCPSCGSSDLDLLGPAEYKCTYCGTGFVLTHAQAGFVDVVLIEAGKNKIDVIKALREITVSEAILEVLDLASAKRLTTATPSVVASNVPLEVGERVKARLEKAGATAELKPA